MPDKIRPLRIFKLGDNPYVIINGKKIPIKGLSQIALKKLLVLPKHKKQPKKKVLKYEDIEKRIGDKLLKAIEKKIPKGRRTITKDSKTKTNLPGDKEKELTKRILELENEKKVTLLQIQKKEAEALLKSAENKDNEARKAQDELEKKKKELEDKEKEIQKQKLIKVIKKKPPAIKYQGFEDEPENEESKTENEHEEEFKTDLELRKAKKLADKISKQSGLPHVYAPKTEYIRGVEKHEQTEKKLAEVEEEKNEADFEGKVNAEFNSLIGANSGAPAFSKLKKLELIPDKYQYSAKQVRNYGWRLFLNTEKGMNVAGTSKAIKDAREQWVKSNEATIKEAIREYLKKHKALGKPKNKDVIDTDSDESTDDSEDESDEEEMKDTNKHADGIYNVEIDEAMEDEPNFYGAISNDEIYDTFKQIIKDKPEVFSFIYLIENYGSKGNNHWVATYVDPVFEKDIGYYDSFGKDASPDYKKKIKLLLEALKIDDFLKWKYNAQKFQGDNALCGIYCMNYVSARNYGHNHKEASQYDDKKAERANKIIFDLF